MADTSYPPNNVVTTMQRAAYPPPNVQPVANEPSDPCSGTTADLSVAHVNAEILRLSRQLINAMAISGAESSCCAKARSAGSIR